MKRIHPKWPVMNITEDGGVEFEPFLPTWTTLAERLTSRLVRTQTGCLEWTGSRNPEGYGQIMAEYPDRTKMGAHRAAWHLAHPGEPMPQMVRHTCDNPPCCEPTHLVGGTHADNMRDMTERSRRHLLHERRKAAGLDTPEPSPGT